MPREPLRRAKNLWTCGQPLKRLPTGPTGQQQKQKRSINVLSKPDNCECYRQLQMHGPPQTHKTYSNQRLFAAA